MLLIELTLRNFRCYDQIRFDNLDRLAIFIGENDVGKTVLLDAVEILVGNKICSPRDFRRISKDGQSDELALEGVFRLEEQDTVPAEYRSGEKHDLLLLRRRFCANGNSITPEVVVVGQGFDDERFDNFVGAEKQKSLLKEFGLTPGSNEPKRKEQRDALVSEGKLNLIEKPLVVLPTQASALNHYLPRVERISSVDYRTPENIIQRTLQRVTASVLMPADPETGQSRELEVLRSVREQITQKLNEEIAKVVPILQAHHLKLKQIYAEPNIDFTRAVSAPSMILDCGEGEQGFDSFGEGTKKRIWMGLLDWERQASVGMLERSVIRLYDEPDVNLHYEAQRQLFGNIQEVANDAQARTQCLVCTHSVTLIDRAPSQAVNLIRVGEDSIRSLCRIRSSGDKELIEFLTDVGHAVGLSNTVLLYERGFLIVEGESEETAIPIIYRNLFGRSMREDGLVLINLHSCSAWRPVIEMLLINRQAMIHILLDADCLSPQSSGRITQHALNNMGCGPDFLNDQVTYIGLKEFEDAFDSDLIARALDAEFPDEYTGPWRASVIEEWKTKPKFSTELTEGAKSLCTTAAAKNAKKPGVARAIARQCIKEADVPHALLTALSKLRRRVGLHQNIDAPGSRTNP